MLRGQIGHCHAPPTAARGRIPRIHCRVAHLKPQNTSPRRSHQPKRVRQVGPFRDSARHEVDSCRAAFEGQDELASSHPTRFSESTHPKGCCSSHPLGWVNPHRPPGRPPGSKPAQVHPNPAERAAHVGGLRWWFLVAFWPLFWRKRSTARNFWWQETPAHLITPTMAADAQHLSN